MPGASYSYTLVADFLGIDGIELILMSLCSFADAPNDFIVYFLHESSKSPSNYQSLTFPNDLLIMTHIRPGSRVEILRPVIKPFALIKMLRLSLIILDKRIVIARWWQEFILFVKSLFAFRKRHYGNFI
jgi:hypothetical protein